MSTKFTRVVTAAAAVAALGLTACSNPSATAPTGGSTVAPVTELTVVTHDSFSVSKELLDKFAADTGYQVTYVAPGDGGALVNQLVLTKDSPLGDVVFGIDNTFAGRALAENVVAPYSSPVLTDELAAKYAADDTGRLTPIDLGDVCLNADTGWFAERNLALPATLDDLLEPEYADLLVVTNPASSSPGLAFLAATVGAKGEAGYLDYWNGLKDNGVLVAKGWTDAYSVQFSGSAGKGPRPLVLSYSTSPAFEVVDGVAPTQALLGTCFRQIEYAGVLAGAKNPEGAQKFIDFMLSPEVQADIPGEMYMYPVSDVELPEEWVRFAPLSGAPITVSASAISEGRDRWIREWTSTVIG